jgi:YHS domain-containing protein
MKNLIILVIILFLGTGLSLNSFSQEKSGDEKKENKSEQMNEASEDQAELNTVCPVSREEADPEITHEYKGKTYALCCNNCLKKFKKDPEKYISKLNEDEKTDKETE